MLFTPSGMVISVMIQPAKAWSPMLSKPSGKVLLGGGVPPIGCKHLSDTADQAAYLCLTALFGLLGLYQKATVLPLFCRSEDRKDRAREKQSAARDKGGYQKCAQGRKKCNGGKQGADAKKNG